MSRLLQSAIVLAALACTASAQTADSPAKFDIADVHPSPRSTNPDTSDMSGGLMRGGLYQLKRATMLDLVRIAYGMDDDHKILGGPNWLEVDKFDVRARVPPGTNAAAVRPMLQALLAERFSLVIHKDTKPVSAWALTSTKHPLLKQSDGSGGSGCRVNAPAEALNQPAPLLSFACRNVTMTDFAAHLGDLDGAWSFLGNNLVVDQTGLEGARDFDFKYTRRGRVTVAAVEIVTLFDGLERIGLKLDPAMTPLPVIVVDSVNRAPTRNSPEAEKAFPPPPTEFEVADVKPSDPDDHDDWNAQLQPGGRFLVQRATLKEIVEEVWGFPDEMVVGAPKFMDTDRWDIVAKAPNVLAEGGDGDFDSLFQMVKSLLADRFRLVVHTEERPVNAYTMTAPKPKLKKADPASRTRCKEGPPTLMKIDPRSANPVLGRLFSCTNTTMAYLASQLQFLASGYVHTDVLDSTGLEGGWDFTLSFSTAGQFRGGVLPAPGVNAPADPNGAVSLPDAMEKQLGLRLELQKRPIPVLVIDHIEQKPTDN